MQIIISKTSVNIIPNSFENCADSVRFYVVQTVMDNLHARQRLVLLFLNHQLAAQQLRGDGRFRFVTQLASMAAVSDHWYFDDIKMVSCVSVSSYCDPHYEF
jgi:hypothetical protein